MIRIDTRLGTALFGAILALSTSTPVSAALFDIASEDGPGEGLNDPTPVAPLPDNPGVTRGEQRRYVIEKALELWGDRIHSDTIIVVSVDFEPLPCAGDQVTLGVGGPTGIFENFPNTPLADTWYPAALADALAGQDLDPGYPDIQISLSTNLDQGCANALGGWHYGTDPNLNQATDRQYLMLTVLHEIAHGLGFSSSVFLATGETPFGHNDVWSHFVFDDLLGKSWAQMTNAERAASTTHYQSVFFDGPHVRAAREQSAFGNRWVQMRPGGNGWTISRTGVALARDSTLPASVSLTQSCIGASASSASCYSESVLTEMSGKMLVTDADSGGTACPRTAALNVAAAAGATAILTTSSDILAPAFDASIPVFNLGTGCFLADPRVRLVQGNSADARSEGRAMLFSPATLDPGASVVHLDPTLNVPHLMAPTLERRDWRGLDWALPLLRDIGWTVPGNIAPDLLGRLNSAPAYSRQIHLDELMLLDEMNSDAYIELTLTTLAGEWSSTHAAPLAVDISTDRHTIVLAGNVREINLHMGRRGAWITLPHAFSGELVVSAGIIAFEHDGSPPLQRTVSLTRSGLVRQNRLPEIAFPDALAIVSEDGAVFGFKTLTDHDDLSGTAVLRITAWDLNIEFLSPDPGLTYAGSDSQWTISGTMARLESALSQANAIRIRPKSSGQATAYLSASLRDDAPPENGPDGPVYTHATAQLNVPNAAPEVMLPAQIRRFPGESFLMPDAVYRDVEAVEDDALRLSCSGCLMLNPDTGEYEWHDVFSGGDSNAIQSALRNFNASIDGTLSVTISDKIPGSPVVHNLSYQIPLITDPDGIFRSQFE